MSILSLQFLGPYLPHTTRFTDTKEDSPPAWRCQWCPGDGAVRGRLYLVCGGLFVLFLQIKCIHNNQQTKQDFMHAHVEGVKKIMSHCRSVAPNFVTAETPPRKWAATCAFLFSPSICAFCPEPVSFHSSNLCRMPPPKRLQDPPFAATGFLGAASPQGQSSCTSLTLQRCHVPELCDSLT